MTRETLHFLEWIHGWLGWASILALAIPAVTLARPRAPRKILVIACTALATSTGLLGGFLYAYYTPMLKRAIYLASVSRGVMMERKEHLAVVGLALAWSGCLLYVAEGSDAGKRARARAAHTCFIVATAVVFAVAVFGALVADTKTF